MMKKIPMPAQFDGAKFAARYSLTPEDFFCAYGELHFPDSLPDQPVTEAPDPPGPSIMERIDALPGSVNSQVKDILRALAKGR